MRRNEPKSTITVRFETSTLKELEEVADKKKRNKTELIRIIVENYLKNSKLL